MDSFENISFASLLCCVTSQPKIAHEMGIPHKYTQIKEAKWRKRPIMDSDSAQRAQKNPSANEKAILAG